MLIAERKNSTSTKNRTSTFLCNTPRNRGATPVVSRAIRLGGLALTITLSAGWFAGAPIDQAAAQDVEYDVIDLGTLGGTRAFGRGISNAGHVVGRSFLDNDSTDQAFRWFEGEMINLTEGMTDGQTNAVDANTAGRVVGSFSGDFVNPARGFLWENGEITILPPIGGSVSDAFAINEEGIVAGASNTASGAQHATVWVNGQPFDLGTLEDRGFSIAADINDRLQVAGQSDTADLTLHAIFWSQPTGMIDLGTFENDPDLQSGGNGINNLGQVVGWSFFANGNRHAFLWESGEGMRDLGTAGGRDWSQAMAVNDASQVVGSSNTGGDRVGFIWDEDSGMRDLNTLIDPNSDYLIFEANDINNAGQIAAVALLNNVGRAVLLDPVGFRLTSPVPGFAGEVNTFTTRRASAGDRVTFVYDTKHGSTSVPGCPDVTVDLANPKIIGTSEANADGRATLDVPVPRAASGRMILVQAVNRTACEASNVVPHFFP